MNQANGQHTRRRPCACKWDLVQGFISGETEHLQKSGKSEPRGSDGADQTENCWEKPRKSPRKKAARRRGCGAQRDIRCGPSGKESQKLGFCAIPDRNQSKTKFAPKRRIGRESLTQNREGEKRQKGGKPEVASSYP